MKARRIDDNQNQVVKALRQIPGVSVFITSMVGRGYPDLNIGFKGENLLIELKDGSKTASRKKLTEDEKKFHKDWKGSVHIVESLEDVLSILKIK